MVPSGNTYVLIVAFNYEETDSYQPSKSGLGQLSCIPDGMHFSKMSNASGASIERYYDKPGAKKSLGFPDKSKIVERLQYYAQQCGPEDSFVFFYAGHGTQAQDEDGDEADGFDEEMCFCDQRGNYTPLRDDEVAAILTGFDTETHILFVTDCCQSGTVCDLSKAELADHTICHMAAVKDTQFAADLGDGGAFTSSLCETIEALVAGPDRDFSITTVYNTCFEDYSNKFAQQDFTFEKTDNCDPDAFRWPLVPPQGWTVDTALDGE